MSPRSQAVTPWPNPSCRSVAEAEAITAMLTIVALLWPSSMTTTVSFPRRETEKGLAVWSEPFVWGERRSGDALDGDGFEDYGSFGAVAAVFADFGDFFYYVVAFDYFAEDGVLAGEPAGVGYGDEELAAVGVGAGVRHGELSFFLEAMFGALGFVGELVAGAAHAGAFGVAALDHELRDDAVEDGSVIELCAFFAAAVPLLGAFGQADEVGHGLGCVLLEQLADYRSFCGLECGVGAGLSGHVRFLLA